MDLYDCRMGVSAVVVNVQARFSTETLMLFPDKNKKTRQMKLYELVNLRDSMPLVSTDTDIFRHEYELLSIAAKQRKNSAYWRITAML